METTKVNKVSTTAQFGGKPHLLVLSNNSSLVNVILHVMTEAKSKDKDTVVKSVVELCKKFDVRVTKQKTRVTDKNARSLLGAIIRDITKERKGWWSLYKVVTEKNKFCFETKKIQATA